MLQHCTDSRKILRLQGLPHSDYSKLVVILKYRRTRQLYTGRKIPKASKEITDLTTSYIIGTNMEKMAGNLRTK